MSPLTFSIIRQSTQLSAARRGTVVMTSSASSSSVADNDATRKDKRVIETPGCFMYSVKGSVPHLTPDTLRLQGFGGVNVSIEQLLQDHQPTGLDKWPFTLSKFLNLQDLILLCDIRDSSSFTKVPFNTDRVVSMISNKGVRRLTLEDYLKVVRAYHPDIVSAFTDSISDTKEPGQKRVRKSVERSLKWLDQVLLERQGLDGLAQDREAEEKKKLKSRNKENQMPVVAETATVSSPVKSTTLPWTDVGLFAHVQGAQFDQERVRSAQETAKRTGVDGYIIDTNALPGSRDDILKMLKISVDHLPKDKPRLVYGMQAPEDVLQSIALGADLFDTSYPFLLTEDGKASLFSFGSVAAPTSTSTTASIGTATASLQATSISNNAANNRWINLWDDEHSDKFVPIMEGCECYACKGGRHTRAYINHLLKAHEMLATVLLMSHNMHQYSKFFANIRQSIASGTFDQLSQQFREQFGTEPQRIPGEIHEQQRIVEASLSKRNRLDSSEGSAATSGEATPVVSDPAELEALKEARKVEKAQRAQEKKLRQMVNKKEKRLQKLKERELLEQQKMGDSKA
ncbi:Queuine tRNA-ribosyltransferase subunit qtrtd1 [Haplosporangium bisporale]|nr:Queuine tRNA-ribosyltransferase subunit qtrtd1 [Haplosporangium bisporale]KAF9203257.1 Queuine tRNA-ribosyltransferase subunit qtrtd1 [Podila verticillata]KAI9235710.1 MAG: tRNA-guanine(15) transglycosylase-like protein [Podila humilis]